MLQNAKVMRELQKKANESYERYVQMKEDVGKMIFSAAYVGCGDCAFVAVYSNENDINLRKISCELTALGYKVKRFVATDMITLHVTWDYDSTN